MSDLIVKAAVKDALLEQNVSADFYDALNEEVAELLDDAPSVPKRMTARQSSPAACRFRVRTLTPHSKIAF